MKAVLTCNFSILLSIEEVVEEHTSVRQVQLAHEQPLLGTLDECFQLYTQDERVSKSHTGRTGE